MTEFKINILILTLVAVALIAGLAWLMPDSSDMVYGAASTLVGGICAVLRDLLAPEPKPVVPAYIVEKLIEQQGALSLSDKE